MPNLKVIIKSLKKRKSINILLLIQLTFSIIVVIYSLLSLEVLKYPQNQISKILKLDTVKIIHIDFKEQNITEEYTNQYNKVISETKNIKGVETVGAYDILSISFNELANNQEFRELRKNLTKGTFKEMYPEALEMVKVDKSIYDMMNLKIDNGRGLNSNEFQMDNKDIIPLLIGSKYNEVLKVGDYVNGVDGVKYEVIGFIEPNAKWLSDSSPIESLLVSLDDKVISPYTQNDNKDKSFVRAKSQVTYITINDKSFLKDIKNKVEAIGKENNLQVESFSIQEEINNYVEKNKDFWKNAIFFGAFLIIMSCIGLVATMVAMIKEREREFGIRMVAGADKRYLKLLVLGEILVLMCGATIITFSFIIYFRISSIRTSNKFGFIPRIGELTLTEICLVILFILLLVVITSFIPLKKISKLQPKDLVGGMD